MKISNLATQNLIILKAISGSKAYGLDTPSSDTDIKGVFYLPAKVLYSFQNIEQVSEQQNDVVFYELRRFVYLLSKNNPNMLELLALPSDCLIERHAVLDKFPSHLFLSKLCQQTFAGYAFTQIQKAKGLNKKVNNPMPRERKSLLDFCHIVEAGKSRPLEHWLSQKNYTADRCGLAKINHVRDVYALFYDKNGNKTYKGILAKKNADQVATSSIPKGEKPEAYLYCNLDGYSSHCKAHRDYWQWVAKRNDARYQQNIAHGQAFDSKNMMHTFRLLDMAKEIALNGEIVVRRPNRQALLDIKEGKFSYDYLLDEAENRVAELAELYAKSSLPESPELGVIEDRLVEAYQELLTQK